MMFCLCCVTTAGLKKGGAIRWDHPFMKAAARSRVATVKFN